MVVHEEFTPGPDLVIDLTMQRGDGEWNVSVAHPPVIHAWPTMLGLLTIIGDAIAAAPWWGDGESVPQAERERLNEYGVPWVSRVPATAGVYVVTTEGVTYDGWVKDDRDEPRWPLADFLDTFTPATVVPTPTADDWIDPAVRLPEVGEWYWLRRIDDDGYMVGILSEGARQYEIDRREWTGRYMWAPILVGPPPIPDAPDDQAAMHQTATENE
jgi:hypothetical protein